MSNFNEAKTKNAHVTHFFSYNKTQLEETAGVLRVAQLLLREDSMEVKNQVSLLQDLRIGRPQTASFVGSIPIF